MTDRPLSYIVKERRPIILPADATVGDACRAMWSRRIGCVLVVDRQDRLAGIFTGRDAVRLSAKGGDPATLRLEKAMTCSPVVFARHTVAHEALYAMNTGGFRHAPVIDAGSIVGVVSRGDFKGMEFEEYRWRLSSRTRSPENRRLGDVVDGKEPVVLTGGQTVARACRIMARRKVGCILVADERGRLEGIFAGRDAVGVLARAELPGATPLRSVMTPDPASLPPDSNAISALRLMNDGGFRHVPVVEDGKIVGVVSRSDFSGREIDRLDEEEHLQECIW